jgi:hypothetical protein
MTASKPAPPKNRRDMLRGHAAATVKVIALSGGLLGGLWLLQMIAQK